ncbi:Serine/threonine protein kinase [Phytophthora megakarya]|uniref:Serine/threonine protein kinase n=1 Tax=Phytophthora megakarya TaxID=4795 RepID=A0A225VFN9_9STRA|nr:Serine/threonine protein kinase [Phytophthora megakarya]
MSSFVVTGLRIIAHSNAVLADLDERISTRMPESTILFRGLFTRLEQAHDHVAKHSQDKVRDAYNKVLVRFTRLLTAKPLLVRLAKSDTTLVVIKELHHNLDSIFEILDLEDTSEWKHNWDEGCAEQQTILENLVSERSHFRLANEVDGDKKLKEALMQLQGAIHINPTGKLAELRQSTLNGVLDCMDLNGMAVYGWFISREDVDCEDEEIGPVGTFAEAKRGTWLHNDNDDEGFLKQLIFWYNLPDHPNVLKLFGGNHVSSPPFFVCEDAHGGNLLDFLEVQENQKHFWKLFLDVAKGIKHLHDYKIVHGAIKGNNILIGNDNVAKIADFGLSSVRSLSLKLSEQGAVALSHSVRWQSKEMLEASNSDEPLFEWDIYAFGMCLIESILGEIPFGTDDDDNVTFWVLGGELPPRPPNASDDVWELISKLCAPDFRNRPSIDDVIGMIEQYADKNTPWLGLEKKDDLLAMKQSEFSKNPLQIMRECLGLEVFVQVASGNTWQGMLTEVKDNGNVVLKPAQELLDKEYGPELPEKELTESEILWLGRDSKPAGYPPTEYKESPDKQCLEPGSSENIKATQQCMKCETLMPAAYKFCGICGNSLLEEKRMVAGKLVMDEEKERHDRTKYEGSLFEESIREPNFISKCDAVCPECNWTAIVNDEFCRRCGYFMPTDAVFA